MSSSNSATTPKPIPSGKSSTKEDESSLKLVNEDVVESSMPSSGPNHVASQMMSPSVTSNFPNVATPKNPSTSSAVLTAPFGNLQAQTETRSLASANSIGASRPLHSVHAIWKAVFTHTARCDGCNKNKQPVMQRCDDCSHQLCQTCMLASSWDQLHDADLSILDWTPPTKKPRRAGRQSGSSSIKKTKSSLPSLEIGSGTKSAIGNSRVYKSVFNKAVRHAASKGLTSEQEKYAYLSPSEGPAPQILDTHRPINSNPLGNQDSYGKYKSNSPLEGMQSTAGASFDLVGNKNNGDLFDNLEDEAIKLSPKSALNKTRRMVKPDSFTTTKTNKAVSDTTPTRRQPPRRKSASGEPVPLPNYQEEEDGGEGEDDMEIDESPLDKRFMRDSTSHSATPFKFPLTNSPIAKARPGGPAPHIENPDLTEFDGALAKAMKLKADEKKKKDQAAKMEALDLECEQQWETNANLLQLRREGNDEEARELLEAAKAMLAIQRGIFLEDNQNEKTKK